MKLAIASDLHLEFGPIVLKNTEGAEVLVLAGDICVANDLWEHDDGMQSEKSKRLHNFFTNCCNEFPHVIYVVGNHEHYHGDLKYTVSHLKQMLKYLPNLVILDKEVFTLGDVTFVGGTLWTDMNKADSLTMFHVKGRMSDYHLIANSNRMVQRKVPLYELNPDYTEDGKNGSKYKLDDAGYNIYIGDKIKEEPSKLSVEDTMVEHYKMLDYIKIVTDMLGENTQKYVVVGHHAPTHGSVHPRFKHFDLMNGAYYSDLSDFILDRPCIKLWVHGHMHDTFDYMVGSTRVVCNPRGYYGHEEQADRFELKFVEV